MSKILVIIETSEGRPHHCSRAAVSFAVRLLEVQGGAFDILVIGPSAPAVALQFVAFGAARVLACDAPDLERSSAEHFIATVVAVAKDSDATHIAASATSWSKDVLPRAAARLDASYISDCVGLSTHVGQVAYEKPSYAGGVVACYTVATGLLVVGVRATAFRAPPALAAGVSPVSIIELTPPTVAASRVEVLGVETAESQRPDLAVARCVVAGGRGLGADLFKVLSPLADELGAAIGASRAACDFGHARSDLQVGQTGKIVAPDLYIAVGISGAIQHTAGIRGARVIMAVNNDPDAPIFSVADFGLVADAFVAIPQLVDRVRRHRQTTS